MRRAEVGWVVGERRGGAIETVIVVTDRPNDIVGVAVKTQPEVLFSGRLAEYLPHGAMDAQVTSARRDTNDL